jgi:cyclopropane fatty-acyl-phospholipid synthase-like methyltransferase
MSLVIPFSDACERNKDVILEKISPYLNYAQTVLEIGSGTGQHAVHFAKRAPHLVWQTSDQQQYIDGINAQLINAATDNILSPIILNVKQSLWVEKQQQYDVIYTANTFHIMSWQEVCAFFNGIIKVINETTVLIVYGPFKYNDKFTSASNGVFDQSLRSRACGSAIRDFESVNELAEQQGFQLIKDHPMPANNQCLIWRQQTN